MPEISCQTLVIAVQAIASEVRTLREALARDDGIYAKAEDYQRLEDLMQAADDLEAAYAIAARTVLNLPPYDALING